MRVLIIDCYDSFTFNLSQLVGSLGAVPEVVMNDSPPGILDRDAWDRIILSPGPGRPEESGLCLDALASLCRRVPTLGVCLGHQAICTAFGGRVTRGERPVHGKTSLISHDGKGIYRGIANPFTATRYHSLVIDRDALPPGLTVTAESTDDGCIMGVRHDRFPIEGVQFHPESILTTEGRQILANFLGGDR
ncbi:MAG: aminodeoxychorismate/anthranilate synthase component II [Methanomicrobiales archaeon]|nr:aminodeoxychorismate/anthranilate synthase component II [Methanomicrobiales archaeon]MDD1668995.1 aminodeoxychorismate/anthranilate synthase component II [Methanomicrobiales archaeon]